MKLLIAFSFVSALLAQVALPATLQVQLATSPAQTLPALPVSMRLKVTNSSAQPAQISSIIGVSTTSGQQTYKSEIQLPPHVWLGESGLPPTFTIPAGATLVRLLPIEGDLASSAIFTDPKCRLGVPGEFDVVVSVQAPDGTSSYASNAVHLSVSLPTNEDVAVWNALRHRYNTEGISLFALLNSEGVVDAHPQSEYARRILPFVAAMRDSDLDRMATNLSAAVESLPGAWIDGARQTIATRYLEAASNASFHGDQALAGQLSAKGRVFTQQLIHAAGSPIGADIGSALEPLLLSTDQWQQRWNSYHPVAEVVDIRPIIDCRQANGDGTYMWTFGYESQSSHDATIAAGGKLNGFAPAPENRGQPTVFHPGVFHGVVTIASGPPTLVWMINGRGPDHGIVPPSDCGGGEISVDSMHRVAPSKQ